MGCRQKIELKLHIDLRILPNCGLTLWTENGKVNLSECMHMLSQSFDFTKNYVMLAFYTNSTMKTKNTFKLHDGPEGHFVSVFLDLLTAQAKL